MENLAPTGILSPALPARSESLYRLRYSGPHVTTYRCESTWPTHSLCPLRREFQGCFMVTTLMQQTNQAPDKFKGRHGLAASASPTTFILGHYCTCTAGPNVTNMTNNTFFSTLPVYTTLISNDATRFGIVNARNLTK